MQQPVTHVNISAATLLHTINMLTARETDLARQLHEVQTVIVELRQQADASALAQKSGQVTT